MKTVGNVNGKKKGKYPFVADHAEFPASNTLITPHFSDKGKIEYE